MPIITDITPAKLAMLVFLIVLLIILIAKLFVLSEYTVIEIPVA